jgi:hypothetical protein
LRGLLHRAGFRVAWTFPETASTLSVRERRGSGSSYPRARSVDVSPHHPPRAGASAVGDAFRSRPARTSQAPSIGFLKDHPSVDMPAGVHSRELAPASARSLPSAALVPPLPFLPASTVCSTNRFAGLLRPASDPEVHRVAAHRGRMPATASALSHRCLPSRAFPFREAAPASPRGPAPLSLLGNADATTRPSSARKSVATDGSWPNRIARCSPGLPHLEPHPNATPRCVRERTTPRAPRTRASAGRMGGRVRQADATAARRPWPHLLHGGGKIRATSPSRLDPVESRPSVPPPK